MVRPSGLEPPTPTMSRCFNNNLKLFWSSAKPANATLNTYETDIYQALLSCVICIYTHFELNWLIIKALKRRKNDISKMTSSAGWRGVYEVIGF